MYIYIYIYIYYCYVNICFLQNVHNYNFFISQPRLHQKNSNTDVATGYHMSYQHHYHHRPSSFHGTQKASNAFLQNDYTPR
jgi:hypothetical protein